MSGVAATRRARLLGRRLTCRPTKRKPPQVRGPRAVEFGIDDPTASVSSDCRWHPYSVAARIAMNQKREAALPARVNARRAAAMLQTCPQPSHLGLRRADR